MEDRDRLRQRQGQIEEQRALPRLAARAGPQLSLPLRCGLRLGGQQPRIDVGGLPAADRRPPQRRAIRGLALTEQQVIRVTLDNLAGGEAERLRGGTPPAARGLTALLARLDVIAGRVQGQGRVDLLPDVVQVVALAQRADDSQRLTPPRKADGTDHDHQMVHGCDGFEGHTAMVRRLRRSYGNGAKAGEQDHLGNGRRSIRKAVASGEGQLLADGEVNGGAEPVDF